MFHVKQFFLLFLVLPFFSLAQHIGSSVLPVKQLPVFPTDNIVNQFLQGLPNYNSLSSTQKEWYYWTNYSRSNPRRFWDRVITPILANYPNLVNSYTASLKRDLYNIKSLPFVKPNKDLIKISRIFASELAANNASPSHTSPSGSTFADRMKTLGVKNCAGENISFGPSNPLLMLVLLYIDEGVPDLGHRKTLLNSSFVEMGIGIATYPDNKNTIVIQDFACDQK